MNIKAGYFEFSLERQTVERVRPFTQTLRRYPRKAAILLAKALRSRSSLTNQVKLVLVDTCGENGRIY